MLNWAMLMVRLYVDLREEDIYDASCRIVPGFPLNVKRPRLTVSQRTLADSKFWL